MDDDATLAKVGDQAPVGVPLPLRQIPPGLIQCDAVRLLGGAPAFLRMAR